MEDPGCVLPYRSGATILSYTTSSCQHFEAHTKQQHPPVSLGRLRLLQDRDLRDWCLEASEKREGTMIAQTCGGGSVSGCSGSVCPSVSFTRRSKLLIFCRLSTSATAS